MGKRGPGAPSAVERFFDGISPEPNTGCWLWTGYTRHGYGDLWVSGRHEFAHRFSWEIHVSPVPAGLFVCHHCDNRLCCNPAHLFVGTQTDNMRDAASKGRIVAPGAPGERHWNARLSDEKVAEIRALHMAGARQIDLCRRFGVSRQHISSLVNGLRRGSA